MKKNLPLPAEGLVWTDVLSGRTYQPEGAELSLRLPARGTAILRALPE